MNEKPEECADLCPRCGEVRLRVPEARNALSRQRPGVSICSECAEDEAVRDMFGDAPLEEWACDTERGPVMREGMVKLPVRFL